MWTRNTTVDYTAQQQAAKVYECSEHLNRQLDCRMWTVQNTVALCNAQHKCTSAGRRVPYVSSGRLDCTYGVKCTVHLQHFIIARWEGARGTAEAPPSCYLIPGQLGYKCLSPSPRPLSFCLSLGLRARRPAAGPLGVYLAFTHVRQEKFDIWLVVGDLCGEVNHQVAGSGLGSQTIWSGCRATRSCRIPRNSPELTLKSH
jgi:hypothetical protein